MTARPRLLRTALFLLPVQALFRGGEIAWPLLLAAWFGRSDATDFYFLLASIYTFASAFLAGAFQDSAIVPILQEQERRGREALQDTASAVLGHTLVAAAAVAAIAAGVTSVVVLLRHRPVELALALPMTAFFTLFLFGAAVRGFYVGVFHAGRRFLAHPVASGAGMGLTIAALALGRARLGVAAAPAALAVGELFAATSLALSVKPLLALRVRPRLRRDEPVRRLFSLLAFEVAGTTVTRLNPVVDQLMAGLSPLAGAGTILRYAADVAALPNSILQAVLYPAMTSRLSLEASAHDAAAFRATVRRTMVGVVALLTGMVALGIALRRPILRALFLHGEMDSAGVEQMAVLLVYTLVGVPAFGAELVLAKAHVALQNGRLLLPIGLLNAALNAVLDVALWPALGLRGVALSTGLMHASIAVALWTRLEPALARLEATSRSAGAAPGPAIPLPDAAAPRGTPPGE